MNDIIDQNMKQASENGWFQIYVANSWCHELKDSNSNQLKIFLALAQI